MECATHKAVLQLSAAPSPIDRVQITQPRSHNQVTFSHAASAQVHVFLRQQRRAKRVRYVILVCVRLAVVLEKGAHQDLWAGVLAVCARGVVWGRGSAGARSPLRRASAAVAQGPRARACASAADAPPLTPPPRTIECAVETLLRIARRRRIDSSGRTSARQTRTIKRRSPRWSAPSLQSRSNAAAWSRLLLRAMSTSLGVSGRWRAPIKGALGAGRFCGP